MRGLLVVLLLLGAGCATPTPDEQGLQLQAFFASYATEQQVPEGEVIGTLHVSLDGPYPAADRDLTIRPAYVLSLTWDRRLHHEQNWTLMGTIGRDYYLDGAWRVVRSEDHSVMGSDGRLRQASWDLQGAPPPLGFGWQRLTGQESFFVQGRPIQPIALQQGSWLNLTDIDLLPVDPFMEFDTRATYDGPRDVAPRKFELPGPTPAATTHGRFTGMFERGPLPAIAPWPLQAYAQDGRAAPWKVLPGEWEDPMGVGSTLDDLLQELVVQEPDAQRYLDSGCLVWAALLPAGGSRGIVVVPGVALGTAASITFDLLYLEAGGYQGFRMHHWVDAQGSRTEVESYTETPSEWTPRHCSERDHAAPRTLLEEMWAGYALPIERSGVPCGAFHQAQVARTPTDVVVLGARDTMHMVFTETNDPLESVGSLASLVWDEEAGGWDSMVLQHLDMVLLDAGGWEPRDVPAQGLQDLQPRAHCVAPTPVEFPLRASR